MTPFGDGSGPLGQGPVGRGLGPCGGGGRRGRGFGRGGGWNQGQSQASAPVAVKPASGNLESEITALKKRLEQLEKQASSSGTGPA